MAKQIIWSPLAKEALKDRWFPRKKEMATNGLAGLCTPCSKSLVPCHAESVYPGPAHRSREHTVHHSASRLYASLPAQSPED